MTTFDEDGTPRPAWQIVGAVHPTELVVPLFVRDRLGLRTSSTIPLLSPPVGAIPSKHLDVGAASASWDGVWTMIVRGGTGSFLPFTPVRFHGLTEHPALIGPWAWLFEEASAWAASLRSVSAPQPRDGREPSLGQQLVADIEAALGRPVKPFHLELAILPVDGVWWERSENGRVFLSDVLFEDTATYSALLRRLVDAIA